MRALAPLALAPAALISMGLGCTDPPTGQGGAGGQGGAIAEGGGGAASTSTTSTGVVVEPDGPPRLTVLNGVVDAPALRLCWLPFPDGATGIEPWPPAPLAFGESLALALPDPAIPQGSDVLVAAVAGDPEGADCAAIVDDPSIAPNARVAVLGVFPEGTFDEPRSLLLVPTGCIAEGHAEPSAPVVCGSHYLPDLPSVGATIAVLSRVTVDDRVSFQAVHASSDAVELDVGVRPSFDGAGVTFVATRLQPGAISPVPAFAPLSTAELGSSAGASTVGRVSGTTQTQVEASFPDAFGPGGLDATDLGNGRGVTLVAVGAPPGQPPEPWHAAFRILAVRPAPLP